MIEPERLEEERIQQLAQEYADRGYDVHVRPSPEGLDLPPGFRPDLVAISPSEKVVIEVKSRASLRTDRDLPKLASLIEGRAGWRLELVVTNPMFAEREEAVLPASPTVLEARVGEAQRLAATGHFEAALLLAWSVLEAGLRESGEMLGTEQRVGSVVKELYSAGLLSDRQYELVDQAADARIAIAHGGAADISPGLVHRLTRLAKKIADPSYPSVGDMVDWFYEHYEDPAAHVPFDSSEGGYQYYAGGPFNAREVIDDQFSFVDEEDRAEAVDLIEPEGFDWVRKSDY
jgi:hypothetical protein